MTKVSAAAKTILVAHGRGAVTDRFVAALDGAGHRAVAVATGKDLLRRMQRVPHEIDLVILDLQLPGGDGLENVRMLRELDNELPVLIFAGTVGGAATVRDLAALAIAGYLNEHSAVQYILPAIAPHLFPDSFNRRSGPRVVLSVSVQYHFANTIAAAQTLDIGSGGIAIRTTSPLESGSRIRVRFRTPGSRRDVDAEGRVVWSDRRVGMGVQFDSVDPAGQAMVDNFVDAHAPSKRAP
jgi:uncharacterized protein (TIGR02266 family)